MRFVRAVSRSWSSLTAAAITTALLIALAFDAGGYFADSHLKAGAVAFAAIGVLLVLAPPSYGISSPALLALGALCGLTVWTAASSHWSSLPDGALEDALRTMCYVGLFGLALLAAGSGRFSAHLVWLVFIAIVAIVVAGLISRLYPDVISAAGTVSRFDDHRLAYPLTYWNAFGALAAMGVVLGAGLAADYNTPSPLRALAAAACVPVGVAGYLSFSRGGWLALGVGVIVLLVLGHRRLNLLVSLAIVGGALLLAILRLRGHPALTDDPALGRGQLEEGHAYAPTVIALTVAAGVSQGAVALMRLRDETRRRLGEAGSRLAPFAAAVAVLALGVGYVLTASTVEGGTAQAIEDSERWVERQWDDFMEPATFSASGAERLTTARGTRSDLYRVAIDGFEAHPLWGDGSAGFEVRFAHDRDVGEKVRDAHSLYLETLGELGLVGIVLLLAFLGALAWGVVGLRLKPSGMSRAMVAAIGAAISVWLAHAMSDWDWQVPALTGAALVLGAAACPVGRSSRRRRRRA